MSGAIVNAHSASQGGAKNFETAADMKFQLFATAQAGPSIFLGRTR
jgi:hypothetical protein